MQFSKQDIIKSVEYQWLKSRIKLIFYIWLLMSVVSLAAPLFFLFYDFKSCGIAFLTWAGIIVFLLLVYGCFILHIFKKMKYLLNNYPRFQAYEVKLDSVSTSSIYRGRVYYSVAVGGKKVDTNPIFSSSAFSRFSPEEYNNKTVVGLYDEDADKFYVIRNTN